MRLVFKSADIVLIGTILLALLSVLVLTPSASAYEVLMIRKLCPEESLMSNKSQVDLMVSEFIEENLSGFSIYKDAMFELNRRGYFKYHVYDSSGNQFFVVSDTCGNIFGPYYKDSDKYLILY